jgi:LPXTG-site transpeptidase (sortase) family protein
MTLFLIVILGILFFVSSPLTVSAQDTASLSIPSLGIETEIVEIYLAAFPDGSVTWDTSTLGTKVGHLEHMPWFGSGDNIALGGHSELENRQPGVFVDLHTIQVGDLIVISINGTEFKYAVTSVTRVDENDLSILMPSNTEILTLFTCDASSYDADGDTYARRVVVTAGRIA